MTTPTLTEILDRLKAEELNWLWTPKEPHQSVHQPIRAGDRLYWNQNQACNAHNATRARLLAVVDRAGVLNELRAILRERSKGEVETWGFVHAFMDMIDEAERSSAAKLAAALEAKP